MPQPVNAYMLDGFGAPFRASPSGGLAMSSPILLSNVSVVRPANVLPYAAGQCWGTAASCVFTFPAVATAGGKGRVVSARLAKTSANIANASFRLWLHNTATLAAQPAADQAAINLAFGDRGKRIGYITFQNLASMTCAEGAGVLSAPELAFDLAGVETALTGFLEVLAAYTPVSSEAAFVELGIAPND